MTIADWIFDGVLVLTLVWLALRTLAGGQLFKSVVLYIAYGLLVALAWVRLSAPDIALAEAAIGAGITGVLLLDAAGHMRGSIESRSSRNLRARNQSAEGGEDG